MKRLIIIFSCFLLLALAIQRNSTLRQEPLMYISPVPKARNINPTTSIVIREGRSLDPQSVSSELFTVSGSRSGRHTGTVRLASDQRTLLFYPDRPFSYGETVSVVLRSGLVTAAGDALAGTSWQFSTLARAMSYPAPWSLSDRPQPQDQNGSKHPAYRTHPEFSDMRLLSVTTPAQDAADGLIFITQQNSGFIVIADDTGEPVYIKRLPSRELFPADFKYQDVGGTPRLTYHVGTLYEGGYTTGSYYVLDQQYNLVDTWTMGNGYRSADLHELLLLDNGDALLLSYWPVPYDLSPWGGPEDGQILDIIIQRQDADKNVIFEWRASDHISPGDTQEDLAKPPPEDATRPPPADILHTNSIEVDVDGNLLISNRHLSEITKINHNPDDAVADGTIMWRLGGKQNEFTFTNDEGFTYQHDVRRMPDGRILLFDNGVYKQPKEYSRVVEYEIDEVRKIITRTWQYPSDKSLYAPFAGNAQRLSNGNTLIGWGALPLVTEVRRDGSKALELSLNGEQSYRAFRFAWEGLPDTPPALVVDTSGDPATATLSFSWNGATDIARYDIYTGSDPDTMSRLRAVNRAGFETSVSLNNLAADTCVFKVRPVHRDGRATPFSNTVHRSDRPQCRALADDKVTSGGVSE